MSNGKSKTRRPAVFSLDDASVRMDEPQPGPAEDAVDLEEALEAAEEPAAGRAVARQEPKGLRRTARLGGLMVSALATLVALGAGLAVTRLVEDLFARSEILGWLALGLAGLAALAFLAIVFREIAGLIRLRRIAHLRTHAERAHRNLDMGEARQVVRQLKSVYGGRSDLSWGMTRLKDHEADIFDADDLLRVAERELMEPLDRAATAQVARAARRVSIVTAVAPMALVDMGFVLMSNLGLLNRLATLYGGRPGTLGLFKLAGMVVTHLTVTGSIAVGDSIIQQFVGHGVAARLSARLGEGVLNGLFTARIGLAAIQVCRPLPYVGLEPPAMSAVMSGVVGTSGGKPEKGKKD